MKGATVNVPLQIQALCDLIRRYATVFRQAWSNRRDTDSIVRARYELAFLPAHLEIVETPVDPAPLWTIYIIGSFIVVVILIAFCCRLDIVAIAPGKLIPNGNVKVIQPASTGIVRRILVQNGESVAAGQVLMELDPVQASADADRARVAKFDALLTIARVQSLMQAQDTHSAPKVLPVDLASAERQAQTQNFAEGVYHEYVDKLASLRSELNRRQAELATTREEIAKLDQTAPLARRQAEDYKDLVSQKFVASHDYIEKQRLAIEQTQELAAQLSHSRELEAAIDEQQHEIDTTSATFRREQYAALDKAEQDARQAEDEETKANARRKQLNLTAPVAGIVQQLNVHTLGGVVTTAQTLMEVVPSDELVVEAAVNNRDIGFVTEGQDAIIKIATFPYTRYGYVTGKVIKVSNDVSTDKKLGAVFISRIRIPDNRFKVENKWVHLTPGMEVTAEIKTGTQKVWQYFLSPLLETGQESLRER
jgi:hemolysin D